MPHCVHDLITSISGWRKIFIPVGSDYKSNLRTLELNQVCHICDEDFLLVYYAMTSYLNSMFDVWQNTNLHTLAFGRDTRATGASIQEAIFHASKKHPRASNLRFVNMGIISAPHIMSYTRKHTDGFVYITASHNPPQYNGIKFGAENGGVLRRNIAHDVIDRFFSCYVEKISTVLANPHKNFHRFINTTEITLQNNRETKRANKAYTQTVLNAVFRGLGNSVEHIIAAIQKKIDGYEKSLGIVWDANGGSRATMFDAEFFSTLKIHVKRMHTALGVFAHRIIPEGDALDDARKELIVCNEASEYKGISSWYPLALALDCDGDRGNIVFYDAAMPYRTHVMKAQEVFVFVLRIELAWQRFVTPHAKLAVVVNGPSTARCEIIAKHYNCKVFRVEVGEANLVAKAEQLRSERYIVPIVGEASNGGIIMYPSTVRDPLCTALSCIKLLLWHDVLVNEQSLTHADVFIDFANKLPEAATTEIEDPLAKLKIPSAVPIEKILQHVVQHVTGNIRMLTEVLKNANIFVSHIRCYNFVGTIAHEYSLEQFKLDDIRIGGLGFYFYKMKSDVVPCAFVWIRPSGTEPFMRLIADVIGENATLIERKLMRVWQSLLNEAMCAMIV